MLTPIKSADHQQPLILQLVALTLQVLEGLRYLHDQGVLHRDIKGANILTTKNGVLKLAGKSIASGFMGSVTVGGAFPIKQRPVLQCD